MKIIYLEDTRHDQFGLGWARRVKVGDRELQISVRPGRRVRLAYSSKYGYHWYGTVYVTGQGELWSGACGKTSSVKSIVEEALEGEFNRLAFGIRKTEPLPTLGYLYGRIYKLPYSSDERKFISAQLERAHTPDWRQS